MRSLRGRFLAAMFYCALIVMIGSLVAISALSRLEQHAHTITYHAWPTADACMEYWIAALSKEHALQALQRADPITFQTQVKWAQQFSQHALEALERAADLEPRVLSDLKRLDLELNSLVTNSATLIEQERALLTEELDNARRIESQLPRSRLNVDAAPVAGIVDFWRSRARDLGSGEVDTLDRRAGRLEVLMRALDPVSHAASTGGTESELSQAVQRERAILGELNSVWLALRANRDAIAKGLQQVEDLIVPEEEARDLVMDAAGAESVRIARLWRWVLVALMVVVSFSAIAVALRLSRRLTSPIHRLVEATRQKTADTNLSTPHEVVDDEIEGLTRSFDRMASALNTSRDDLIASEMRYRALFEHARHGIAVLDPEGKILEANRALAQLVGITRTQLPGRPAEELVATELRPSWERLMRAMLSESHLSVEIQLTSNDNALLVEGNCVLLPDNRRVLVLRDVSERRRIEEALIHNEKLSAIGQLAAGVAHELRNPLFVISNVIYDLRESLGDRSVEVTENLEIAEQENQRARKIIDNLLEFSRRGPSDVRRLQPTPLIRQVATLFRKGLQERGVVLDLDLKPTRDCVFEPDAFKQVMVNLISNAIDAMPEGGTLAIGTCDRPGGVLITVRDSGVGIPSELRASIFNPFFSTKAPGAGTGLGLWLVHSTVSRFHGRVEVESRQGAGSTFSLELRAVEEQSA